MKGHRVKPGPLLEKYMKVAREYEGQQEVEFIVKMTRPKSQSFSQTSTSTKTTSDTIQLPSPESSRSSSTIPGNHEDLSLISSSSLVSSNDENEDLSDKDDSDYKEGQQQDYFEGSPKQQGTGGL